MPSLNWNRLQPLIRLTDDEQKAVGLNAEERWVARAIVTAWDLQQASRQTQQRTHAITASLQAEEQLIRQLPRFFHRPTMAELSTWLDALSNGTVMLVPGPFVRRMPDETPGMPARLGNAPDWEVNSVGGRTLVVARASRGRTPATYLLFAGSRRRPLDAATAQRFAARVDGLTEQASRPATSSQDPIDEAFAQQHHQTAVLAWATQHGSRDHGWSRGPLVEGARPRCRTPADERRRRDEAYRFSPLGF